MDSVRGFSRQDQQATLVEYSERFPQRGALFDRQSDNMHHFRRLLCAWSFIAIRINSARLRAPMRSITQAR